MVLFGTRAALGRHLGQAEVVFEYRSSEASIPYQQREEFRQGFFSILDDLWNLIKQSDLKRPEPTKALTFGQFWRERFLPMYEQT
ncbi:MAG TPA: hypothetical protein VN633_15925, partial [Bryobacteraceae bacterium]|nr:hypothetical protein [Bryobacteraceae bacterium]